MRKYRLAPLTPHSYARWDYTLRRDGSICLHGYRGNRDELHIPDQLLGRPVTALADGFFCGAYVQLATIPPTVTRIGPFAFASDEDLQVVQIPSSVTYIDETAFQGRENLVICVEEGSCAHAFAFSGGFECEADATPELECDGYENFMRGSWRGAFMEDGHVILREYCGKERVVEVPAEVDGCPVVTLSQFCFSCNDFVEEIFVPDSVTRIQSNAFSQCASLRRVRLPENLKELGMGAFAHCRDMEEIRLPQELELIDVMAFLNCVSLRTVSLPDSVRLVCPMAFAGCSALEKICLNPTLETVFPTAFDHCPRLRMPKLPDTLDAGSHAAFEGLQS